MILSLLCIMALQFLDRMKGMEIQQKNLIYQELYLAEIRRKQ